MSVQQTRPVAPAAHSSRPSVRKGSRSLLRRFSLYLVAMGVAIALLVLFGTEIAKQSGRLTALQVQRGQLQGQLAEAGAKGEELRLTMEHISDDKYLERRAREFGYIKNGEIALVAQPVSNSGK